MIPGFYKLSIVQRRQQLMQTDFGESDMMALAGAVCDETNRLERMSENVVGALRLPMGILTGLIVNGIAHVVPMATEEPSVVAAVNRTARLINAAGGIQAEVMKPVTTAQIMLVICSACAQMLCDRIMSDKGRWLDVANRCDEKLISLGGGAFDLDSAILPGDDEWAETFVVTRLHVHTLDAMGANIVNTMAEAVMGEMVREYHADSRFSSIEPGMAILTNASPGRMVTASVSIPFECIEGICGIDGEHFSHLIARSSAFASRSSERAITHNKGILNGIMAAALAFGEDTRALGIAATDYACRHGHQPLARWTIGQASLKGTLRLPIVAGFVGGTKLGAPYQAALKLAEIHSYHSLCSVLAGVGLAQNLGALWALSTEGIQAGHMKLHLRKMG
jgi:hydroxymethylglutaryl-CoA reductase